MGFMDELKRLTHPYPDDDDELDEYEDGPDEVEEEEEEEEERPSRRTARAEKSAPKSGSGAGGSYYAPSSRDSKVVNFGRPASETMQVYLVEPKNSESVENMRDIAQHLIQGDTVVLNMEKTDEVTMDHMLFFMGGVAFAQDGNMHLVSDRTFIVMPKNVSMEGKLRDELENSGWLF